MRISSQFPSLHRAIIAVAVAFAMALGAIPAHALTSDSAEPISIEADRAEADDARRVTVYRGDVVITQGSLRIQGETVTIYYDEDNELTKLVSVGVPARFRQLPDGETEYRTARAKRMEYYAGKDLIVLLGDARYGKGDSTVKADRIVYDSKNSRFKAQSAKAPASGGKKTRVKIKIVPKKKN